MRRKLAILLALAVAAANAWAEENSPAIERIAFGSCNREYRPQPLWKPIRACHPDLWIWLGDIVYGRADDLADLARRYQTEKDQSDYKALRHQSRVIGTWDDNDYGVSDGGKNNPNKVASQRLLLDFLDEPAESPRRKQAGVFASYNFGPSGKRVKVILLDGRYYRDRPGATADILGAEQWKWLEQQLSASDADVHLIGSGSQVISSEHRFEKWADFPHARQRLFDLVARSGARNVIFLSGDRHFGEISRLTDPRFSPPLYDITSSGMTHHAENSFLHNFSREPNQFRRGQNFLGLNFGVIQFNWDATPPTAILQIHDTGNTVRIEEKIPLALPKTGPPAR